MTAPQHGSPEAPKADRESGYECQQREIAEAHGDRAAILRIYAKNERWKNNALGAALERGADEITTLRARLAALEAENARLRQVPDDAVEPAARAMVRRFVTQGAQGLSEDQDWRYYADQARAALTAAAPAMRVEAVTDVVERLQDAAGIIDAFPSAIGEVEGRITGLGAETLDLARDLILGAIRTLAAQPQPEAQSGGVG